MLAPPSFIECWPSQYDVTTAMDELPEVVPVYMASAPDARADVLLLLSCCMPPARLLCLCCSGCQAAGGLRGNWPAFWAAAARDHSHAGLIWNESTRRELRGALEREIGGLRAAQTRVAKVCACARRPDCTCPAFEMARQGGGRRTVSHCPPQTVVYVCLHMGGHVGGHIHVGDGCWHPVRT